MDNKILSVVIVTWNSEDEIDACIGSILKTAREHGFDDYEIIIVDNASGDETVNIIEGYGSDRIRLIVNGENTGYTKASNQGIETAKGEYVLLLNPDTVIKGNALRGLVDYLKGKGGAGAAAPQLLNEDGTIQKSCRKLPRYPDMFFEMSLLAAVFPKSSFFARWKMNYFDHNSEQPVEQPMAAALMIKKRVLDNVGNMDSRYQMFFNDVDLCRKILDSGKDIMFYPAEKIVHAKGKSVYKDRARMIKIWNDDCLKYFKKYHNNIVLYPLLFIGIKTTGAFRILFYKIFKN